MKTRKFTPKQLEKLERLHFLHKKFYSRNKDGGLTDKEDSEYNRLQKQLGFILPF